MASSGAANATTCSPRPIRPSRRGCGLAAPPVVKPGLVCWEKNLSLASERAIDNYDKATLTTGRSYPVGDSGAITGPDVCFDIVGNTDIENKIDVKWS